MHSLEDAAIAAGAAIAVLDAVVRRNAEWAGAWRQRLALQAAAVTAKQAGRVEDEAALRDAVLLTRPRDDVGPAGRLVLAWRHLVTRPAADLSAEQSLTAVLQAFGYPDDGDVASALAAELRQIRAGNGTVEMFTGASAAAERFGFGRALGAWLADALLAQRLGWAHAVPLLGAEAPLGAGAARRRQDFSAGVWPAETQADRAKILLAAQARAALRAIDLFAELGRRADGLFAVVPKLRAKGAEVIVDRLLNEDALVAARGEQKNGMSDRGLRRLFDRLMELGAVRELSGRPTFRIYGL